jgi:chromate transporter
MNDIRDNIYWQLIAVFAPLSLLSLGGGQSVMAEIQQQVVTLHHWSTYQQFVDMFAISRAAPGPGSLLVTLIGWHVAGWVGAMLASLALYAPSSLLAYAVTRVWNRGQGSVWHRAFERGLAPLATGLILAGAFAILKSTSGQWSLWILAAAATAVFLIWPRLNPILVLAVAGALQVATHMLGY